MELTLNSRRPFPYLLPCDILGRSLNIPSSVVPSNPPATPTVSRLSTPSRVPLSIQNPLSNSHMGVVSMPPISFLNVGSQFVPPTSQTSRGSYVHVIYNIPQPPHPAIGPSSNIGFGPIGLASQPLTSS